MKVIVGSNTSNTFSQATDRSSPSRISVTSGSTSDALARITANAAYNQANLAYGQANAAFAAANVANNGANTVHVFANGTSVLPNSTLNFNNSATINVAAVANGVLQTNVSFAVNTNAIGLQNYVLKTGDTITGNLNVNASLNVTQQIYANTVDFGPYELTSNTFTSNLNVPIEVDSFSAALYSTVKYIIQVKTTNNIHATEILCVQDGISTYMTEYATLVSGDVLGSFSVEMVGGRMRLNFIPDNPLGLVMTFKVVRYSISS